MTIVSMTETATAAIAAPVLSISCGGSGRDSGGGGGGTVDHGNRIVHGVCTGVLQGWRGELHILFSPSSRVAQDYRGDVKDAPRSVLPIAFSCRLLQTKFTII